MVDSGLDLLSGSFENKWLLTLVDQAIVSGASFLVGVIIGRVGGKEQLGLYVLGLTIIGLLMVLQVVLIWAPYTVFSPQREGLEHALYTGSTLVHQLGLSALGILSLSGMGILLSWGWGPSGLKEVVWTLAIAGSFIAFREYIRQVCFAALQFKVAIVIDGGTALVQCGALLWLAYLDKVSASSAFLALALGCGLASLSWLALARKSLALSLSQVISDLGRNWSFGKWVLGTNLAEFANWPLYQWIL